MTLLIFALYDLLIRNYFSNLKLTFMKNLVMLAMTVFLLSGVATAQDSADDVFYFDFMEDKIDDSHLDPGALKSHYMGAAISKKFQLLQESYTWTQEASATAPGDKTVVEKPSIYYALKKLSNSYKKRIKKGEISKEDALDELTKALDIGLSIRYQSTDEFEAKLKGLRSPEEIAYMFSEKVKLQY